MGVAVKGSLTPYINTEGRRVVLTADVESVSGMEIHTRAKPAAAENGGGGNITMPREVRALGEEDKSGAERMGVVLLKLGNASVNR